MKMLEGWITDVHLSGSEVAIRVMDTHGHAQVLRDSFIPAFQVGGEAKELRSLGRFILDQPWNVKLSWADFVSSPLPHPIRVLEVEVMNPNHFCTIYERVTRARPKLEYYNGPDSILRQFLDTRGLSLFAFCQFIVNDEHLILAREPAVSCRAGALVAKTVTSENKKRT